MRRAIPCTVLAAALSGGVARAQDVVPADWAQRADAAQRALVQCFWNADTDLFGPRHPTVTGEARDAQPFDYWWQAHAIDALVDGFERTGDRDQLARAARLWAGVVRRNGGVTNDYYDDMLWMALALQRLHVHTHDDALARDVDTLWRDVRAGWNDRQGGGIAWRKTQRDYKNTPANAPAVVLAVRLSRARTDAAERAQDLAFAERVYAWHTATLVDPATGFVWDGVNRTGDGRVDVDWAFTYNQGTRIGAAVELHRATGEQRFLDDAGRTFRATLDRLVDEHGVLRERGRGDGGLFKGILIRYVGELIRLDPAAPAGERAVVARQAEAVWAQLDPRAQAGAAPLLFAADWRERASTSTELSAQLSGVMLFEQMARIERSGR